VILNGTKIVMTIGRTKFIDSVNYIPMRLSDLLSFQAAGYNGLRHFCSTQKKIKCVGLLPDARYYSLEQMIPADRE